MMYLFSPNIFIPVLKHFDPFACSFSFYFKELDKEKHRLDRIAFLVCQGWKDLACKYT